MLDRIADGRTDLVFEYVEAGHAATTKDSNGVSLVEWCAYYGDVSGITFLLSRGASLQSLGDDLGLNGAAFHGHWRLCQFLLERGADANHQAADTGESALHSALSSANRTAHDRVLQVLLAHGANPNVVTKAGAPTGAFMRDCRTRAETPLHRAAAFGGEETIELLLDAGAVVDAKDMHGDSPLTWASWHLRPLGILRKLCYGDYRIRADSAGMASNLQGRPHR